MAIRSYNWVFVERFGSIAVKFGFMMILARLLTPVEFGNFAIVNYIILTLSVVIDSGLGGALVRKKEAKTIDYATINTFLLFMSSIIFVLLVVMAPWIADYYNNESLEKIFYILGFCLFIRAITVIQVVYLTKNIRFREQALCNLIATTLGGSIAVILALNHFSYWALVMQQIVEGMLLYVLYRYLNKGVVFKSKFSFVIFKEHFSFGSKLAISNFLEAGGTNLVVNAIAKQGGVAVAGSYSQISKINEVFIGVMTTTIDKAAFPILVSLNSKDFKPYLENLLSYVLFILYYFISLIVITSKDVIQIAIGIQWVEYSWILQLIMLCGFSQLIETVMRSALKAQGKSDFILKLGIFKFSCLFLALFLLSVKGIQGVLSSVLLTSIISAIAYLYITSQSVGIKKISLLKRIYPPLVSSILSIALLYTYQNIINDTIELTGLTTQSIFYYPLAKLILISILLFVLYFGFLLVVANSYTKQLFFTLNNIIRGKS